jgi:hypothetical protein
LDGTIEIDGILWRRHDRATAGFALLGIHYSGKMSSGINNGSQTMGDRKYRAIRPLRVKKGTDLKTIYAKIKRSFTAADLQQFTETEEGVPAEQVLADLEALANAPVAKPKKK